MAKTVFQILVKSSGETFCDLVQMFFDKLD